VSYFGVNIGKMAKNFRPKTLMVKNKNLKFQNFSSPFPTSSYKNRASKIEIFFDPNLHIPLMIEGSFFPLKRVVLNLSHLDFEIIRNTLHEIQDTNYEIHFTACFCPLSSFSYHNIFPDTLF